MTSEAPAKPVFPGGMETAPEATATGCAHPACLCPVDAGRTFCCVACARAEVEADLCDCGHFGCTNRQS